MRRESLTDASLYHFDRNGQVEAHLRGQLDLSNCHMLRAGLDQMLATDKNVVIHLDGLEFMDVTAARVIWEAGDAARDRGRALLVANPRPTVRRLLILLGMDALLLP